MTSYIDMQRFAQGKVSRGTQLDREISGLESDINDRMRNRSRYREWESARMFRDNVRWLIYELREARAELSRYQQPELFDLDQDRRWDIEAIAS
jgi:hypothetical protein